MQVQVNRRRRRISEHQEWMLATLRDGKPIMASELASEVNYARVKGRQPLRKEYRLLRESGYPLPDFLAKGDVKLKDPKTAVKAAKQALKRLEAWGLVRTFKAPHRDADITREQYETWALGIAERQGYKGIDLDPRMIRLRESLKWEGKGSVAPYGNRRVPALWAEITEAGRDWLRKKDPL